MASTFNLLSAHPTKWSNTLKQFVGKLRTNCLSLFDHFVSLALKGLGVNMRQEGRGGEELKMCYSGARRRGNKKFSWSINCSFNNCFSRL